MNLRATGILSTFLFSFAPAYADPTSNVSITVANNDTQDLMVAVADQNQSGAIVFKGRINQGQSTNTLSITADGSGNGSVNWQVVTTSSPPASVCGSASGLNSGSQVNVASWGSGASPC
jgi:hypothetical protein